MMRTRFRFLSSATVILAIAAGLRLHGGGWAVITLDELPDRVEAGQPVSFRFMVRQHGMTPLAGLEPSIEATAGSQKVSVRATAGSATGRYSANLTLPTVGEWSITIHSGFIDSKLKLLPLHAVDRGTPVRAATNTDRGRRLFVAKGCVTCHVSEIAASTPSLNLAPALVPMKYQDAFLARALENPATLVAARPQAAQMPDLNLQQEEIAALVAFINHGSKPITTAQKER